MYIYTSLSIQFQYFIIMPSDVYFFSSMGLVLLVSIHPVLHVCLMHADTYMYTYMYIYLHNVFSLSLNKEFGSSSMFF